jgi:hypothetical protein
MMQLTSLTRELSNIYWSEWNKTLENEAGKAQHDQSLSLQSFLASITASAGIYLVAFIVFLFLKDHYPSI